METALGVKLNDLKLTSLTREDARKVRDYILGLHKKSGGTLSPESVKRDLVILSAMTTYALTEFGLDRQHRNPFSSLPILLTKEDRVRAIERREPLSDELVSTMTRHLSGELNHIWRILAGTGCRLAEVTGLRIQDVRVNEEAVPHIRVAWHEKRRVKTASSIRSVPLVGDALAAASEAKTAAGASTVLFKRYAHSRGADAASAILMKHLRGVTSNPKHVVHSLRHRMKDKLWAAGTDRHVQDVR